MWPRRPGRLALGPHASRGADPAAVSRFAMRRELVVAQHMPPLPLEKQYNKQRPCHGEAANTKPLCWEQPWLWDENVLTQAHFYPRRPVSCIRH